MLIAAQLVAGLAAVLHVVFFVFESLLWTRPEVYARFGIARGEFDVLATLRRAGEPYTLSPRQLSSTLMLTTGGISLRCSISKIATRRMFRSTAEMRCSS